jgi:hypothetical protein
LESLFALAHHMMCAIRRRDVTRDVGDCAHTVHVDGYRIDNVCISLHQDPDGPLITQRLLRRHYGARTADRDGQHDAWEKHRASNGNDDEGVWRQWRRMRRARVRGPCGRLRALRFNHRRPPIFAAR